MRVQGRSVGLGRKDGIAPDQLMRALRFPFKAGTSTRKGRFWQQDGAWLDQNGYGTCVAFACAHRIADKPWMQLPGQISEEWAYQLYRQATGDTSMQEGTWANIVAEELLRDGLISRFEWINNVQDLRYALLERGSVPVGIPWYDSMFNPVQGADGHAWIEIDRASGLAGGHEVLANGLRLERVEGRPWWKPFYRIKNSWGNWWGENGTARVDAEDLEHLIYGEWGDAIWLKEPGA